MEYKVINLFGLIQNPIISSIALHSFVSGYNNVTLNRDAELKYPKLEYLFYVLPIVYHQRSLDIFVSARSMHRALERDNSITIGLQERALKMVAQTYEGLNLSFSKNLLTINKSNVTIELVNTIKRIPLPNKMVNYDLLKIQRCANQLGYIFAKTDDRNLQLYLNIRF